MTGTVIVTLLLCAAAATAAYWYVVFRRVLPLELGGAREAERGEDLRRFTLEILDLELSTQTAPHALNEMAQRVVAGLHRRQPELSIAWFRRQEPGQAGTVVASRGRVWKELPPPCLDFGSPLLREVVERGSAARDLLDPAVLESSLLLGELVRHGICSLKLVAWGQASGGPGGALAIADRALGRGSAASKGLRGAASRAPASPALAQAAPFVDVACRLAGSLSRLAADLAMLDRASERLQGGLSATLDELTQTQSRLITKSREARTMQDVAAAVAARGMQTQSTLSAIVSIVAKSLEADLAAFLLLDEETGELVTQEGAYGLDGEGLHYRIALSRDDSSSARVFKTLTPFMTGDAQDDPGVVADYAKLWGVRSLIVAPLVVQERCIGVMRVGSRTKDFFTREHLQLVSVVAEEAAVIVETAILNRRLSEVAEQLTSLGRMKDEFVTTVSHEFKTPLTAIIGFLTVMIDGETGPMTAEQTRFLTRSKLAAKRLAAMVSELLDISKLEAGVQMERSPIDFGAVLKASVEAQLLQAERAGKTLSCEVPEDLPQVLGDERWLGRVTDNLVSNAVKFTRAGGCVRVSLADKGERILLCVADDGVGIHPDDKPRIFEKFFRARNLGDVTVPGTGLGLAIVREVVTKHGGEVWFESEPGKGSRFFCLLPADRRRADARSRA